MGEGGDREGERDREWREGRERERKRDRQTDIHRQRQRQTAIQKETRTETGCIASKVVRIGDLAPEKVDLEDETRGLKGDSW